MEVDIQLKPGRKTNTTKRPSDTNTTTTSGRKTDRKVEKERPHRQSNEHQ